MTLSKHIFKWLNLFVIIGFIFAININRIHAAFIQEETTYLTVVENNETALNKGFGASFYVAPELTITSVETLTSGFIILNNVPNDVVFSYEQVNGLTVTYDQTKKVYVVEGVAEASSYQSLFRSFQMTVGTTATTDMSVSFTVSTNTGSAIYFSETGHYYDFVRTTLPISWTDAKSDAASKSIDGRQGYLVTITSAAENSFVMSKVSNNGWIGASDSESEGIWKWMSGPEAGIQFWQDNVNAGTSTEYFQGYTVNGMYANFASGEPNNWAHEDYAHIYAANGTWNDFPLNNGIYGYLIEYGGLDTDSLNGIYETSVFINVNAQHQLTINNGLDVIFEEQVTEGTDITSILNDLSLDKTGYTFSGWDQPNVTTMPSNDLVLNATWMPIVYQITYHLDGGSVENNPVVFTIESETIDLMDATKAGHSFEGWFWIDQNEDYQFITELTTGSTGDIDIYASWQINQYTITFDSDGGSLVTDITQDYMSVIEVPEAPTKAGYTFTGWDQDVPVVMPIDGINLVATWQINSYVVTFYDAMGEILNEVMYVYQNVLSYPSYEKAGYDFNGWMINDVIIVGDVYVIGDLSVYPNMTAHQYTYSIFYLDEVYQIEVTSGERFESSFDFQIEGLTFRGFYTGLNGTGDKLDDQIIINADDVTIYPYFEKTASYNGLSMTYDAYHFNIETPEIEDNNWILIGIGSLFIVLFAIRFAINKEGMRHG